MILGSIRAAHNVHIIILCIADDAAAGGAAAAVGALWLVLLHYYLIKLHKVTTYCLSTRSPFIFVCSFVHSPPPLLL